MKKYYLLLVILGMFSCSGEDFIEPIYQEATDGQKKLKQASDGIHDLLGYSYDITKEYLHVDAAPRMVIDIDAFKAANNTRYYNPATTIANINIYAGATSSDMLNEIKTKSSVTANANYSVFSASIKVENEMDKKYAFSSKYSYARADVIKRVRRLYVNADIDLLKNYIYPTFFEDLNNFTPERFVKEYGTHVLTDITIGGRLSFLFRSTIYDETNYTRKKQIVEAGVKFAVGKFGADSNNSHTNETIKSLNTKNATWKTWIQYHGGDGSGLSLTYDSQTGYQTTTFNLHSWEASVNKNNAALVDINWSKAYPIYEFISDPVKKQQIKLAVEAYVEGSKVEVTKVKPFYRLYAARGNNSFFTTDLNEVNSYIQYHFMLPDPGHNPSYVLGYVFENQEPGTVPIYRLYRAYGNNSFLTTSLSEANYYVSHHGFIRDPSLTSSYIIGYIYSSEKLLTNPLYRLYQANGDNSFFTTNLSEANYYIAHHGYARDPSLCPSYIMGHMLLRE